jgi:hypothetical protein
MIKCELLWKCWSFAAACRGEGENHEASSARKVENITDPCFLHLNTFLYSFFTSHGTDIANAKLYTRRKN